MLGHGSIEGPLLGIELLGRFGRSANPGTPSAAPPLARDRSLRQLGLTDDLSLRVVPPLLHRYPGLIPALQAWTRSPSLWVRRAAAVSLVPPRRGERLAAAYRIATALLPDPEDLIHEGTGWLLREAGKTDRQRLETDLLAHGRRLPRTALRYAIEHFPAARGRAILARTKGRREEGGP